MPKRQVAPIVAGPVTLRLLEERDLPMTLAWRNKDRVRSQLVTSRPIADDEHRAWYTRYAERDDDFVFIIEEGQQGRPVGQVSVYAIDWQAGTAEFGRLMIGENGALGRGFAHAATGAAVRLAFETFRLAELRLEVFDTNERAIAIYRGHGFVEAGRREKLLLMYLRPTPSPATEQRKTSILEGSP